MKRYYIWCLLLSSFLVLNNQEVNSQKNSTKNSISTNIYANWPNNGSYCGTGRQLYLQNAGNLNGEPLALGYEDIAQHTEFSSEWRAWHKKVSEELNKIFKESAKTIDADGKLVVCGVFFVVTDKGKVRRAEIIRSSGSKKFDSCALDSIKKLSINPVLKFPEKNEKKYIGMSKMGRFVQNYGKEIMEKERQARTEN